MSWLAGKAPLPLLGKELAEQAARRRTYALRMLCAAVLFTAFGLFAYDTLQRDPYGAARLGRGVELFDSIMSLLFIGILVFLPAMVSSALTSEKERGTLPLLLVTDLRPWEILLGKYGGRLVPMLTILLLAMPLMALCYALGGLTPWRLLTGVYVLGLTCLSVGAMALLCSAWCRTSAGAFLSAYVLCWQLTGSPRSPSTTSCSAAGSRRRATCGMRRSTGR